MQPSAFAQALCEQTKADQRAQQAGQQLLHFQRSVQCRIAQHRRTKEPQGHEEKHLIYLEKVEVVSHQSKRPTKEQGQRRAKSSVGGMKKPSEVCVWPLTPSPPPSPLPPPPPPMDAGMGSEPSILQSSLQAASTSSQLMPLEAEQSGAGCTSPDFSTDVASSILEARAPSGLTFPHPHGPPAVEREEALRHRLKEEVLAAQVDLPPLCPCRCKAWDPPGAHAVNCSFHQNPLHLMHLTMAMFPQLRSVHGLS
eukprot:GGOE01019277.1.p1 GENE.GGOE01019277.1~~GGOE01019277.1.p1  ORF type:complete len:273 (+),score=20.01 GGOE01019277.1:61-819(+)